MYVCSVVIGTVYTYSWISSGATCVIGYVLFVVFNHLKGVPICNIVFNHFFA